MTNLLVQPFIHASPGEPTTLPGVLARLVRDEVDAFSALRAHQAPAWHMFLVQIAALALHRADRRNASDTEEDWRNLLRGLTPQFTNDEPWSLVVDDGSLPAFLQPPVPDGSRLENDVPTPDALDLLITARNHDLKQAIARLGDPQDWVFALVSLQTGEGYGGAGNQGIARMNGGSSSRTLLGLAPLSEGTRTITPRWGPWFKRDVEVLLQTRDEQLRQQAHLEYKPTDGIGLTWTVPWPEGAQLQLRELDIWFVDTCRRIRLRERDGRLFGKKGNSKATRIQAKHLKGVLGDPWAPVHKAEAKSFTLGEGDFGYRTLARLLLGEKSSHDWLLPVLARPTAEERDKDAMVIVAAAIARGNSKTEGFRSRVLPIGGRRAYTLSLEKPREKLFQLAQQQMVEIARFDTALRYALALVAAGGDHSKIGKNQYETTREARSRFDAAVDPMFFEHLWQRNEAQEKSEEAMAASQKDFVLSLFGRAKEIFETALPSIPCPSLLRPRSEVRARNAFFGTLYKAFPELFQRPAREEMNDVPV